MEHVVTESNNLHNLSHTDYNQSKHSLTENCVEINKEDAWFKLQLTKRSIKLTNLTNFKTNLNNKNQQLTADTQLSIHELLGLFWWKF